jgi:hypothetical protein
LETHFCFERRWSNGNGFPARSQTAESRGRPISDRLGEDDMQYISSLINDLLEKPANLSTASEYTAMNGLIYLTAGVLLIVWPGLTQTLFMDRAFVGDEQGLIRVMGLTVVVIGWLYLFGGRSGARQVVAASVVDRLIFVPGVLVPLAIAGVFPHLLLAFAFLDVALAIGAWVIFGRVT